LHDVGRLGVDQSAAKGRVVIRVRGRRVRALRVLMTASLAGAIATSVFPARTSAVTLQIAFVSLHGEGAWGVAQQLVPWQNELSTAKSFIDLNYQARGSYFGRQDLVGGDADFAISGLPFTKEQLDGVKGGASAFISAPVSVATLATLVEPPYGGFVSQEIKCDPDDPSTWPPYVTDGSIGCVVRTPITDPIRIPNRNLVAMYLNYGGGAVGSAPALNNWNNAGITGAMNIQEFQLQNRYARPDISGRSDPDETSYYLQQFESTAAHDVWADNQKFYPGAVWSPITERTPVVVGVSRDGAEQQVDQLANKGSGVGVTTAAWIAGGLAAAPPSTIRSINSTFPNQEVDVAQMQNANGDWVGPTPDAVNKAVDAGGDKPLYALTNKVPGAYPLVWVDNLYAPAHGLSIEKTEGLATLIRYLVTSGQNGAAAVGEGRLPDSLVTEALQDADALVASNCQGSDREILVDNDPGPLAPATATDMESIGSMKHCVPAPDAPSTTTPTTITSTGNTRGASTGVPGGTESTGGFDSSGTPSFGAGPVATPSGATGGAAGPTAVGTEPDGTNSPAARDAANRTVTGVLTASKLPLPLPTGSGTDRLATFLLGAVLYLCLRKPVGRLARRVAS
jgi:ABC-type phosphate transport system substrate-binding protein